MCWIIRKAFSCHGDAISHFPNNRVSVLYPWKFTIINPSDLTHLLYRLFSFIQSKTKTLRELQGAPSQGFRTAGFRLSEHIQHFLTMQMGGELGGALRMLVYHKEKPTQSIKEPNVLYLTSNKLACLPCSGLLLGPVWKGGMMSATYDSFNVHIQYIACEYCFEIVWWSLHQVWLRKSVIHVESLCL